MVIDSHIQATLLPFLNPPHLSLQTTPTPSAGAKLIPFNNANFRPSLGRQKAAVCGLVVDAPPSPLMAFSSMALVSFDLLLAIFGGTAVREGVLELALSLGRCTVESLGGKIEYS